MKISRIIGVLILLAFSACFLLFRWEHDEPRRHSLEVLQDFGAAIDANSPSILDKIVLPAALSGRTSAEQAEFLSKALRDEISTDGIAALKLHASFGPLGALFPQEGESWAKQGGVSRDDCVAFRMERNGVRAEVVLAMVEKRLRILRCNNVRQMAGLN